MLDDAQSDAGAADLGVDGTASTGFERYEATAVRVRAGANNRTIRLAIAKLSETVRVGRDPRERASDPRNDAFALILGQAEINELPDDVDDMEQLLKDMAGPGAVLRVNGFRGGRLPPKDQIAQVRFRRNMFAADAHEPGFMAVDIITRPGLDNWRGSSTVGFRADVLSARNAFAPAKGDERNARIGFSLNGPLWKKHTSLSVFADGTNAFDSRTIVAALPSGYFADTVRKPNDVLNASGRIEHALSTAQMLRLELQRNQASRDNLGVGDFDLAERAYRQRRTEDVFRGSVAGSIRKSMFNELRVQWRQEDIANQAASAAAAVLVLNAFNAGGAQIAGGRASRELELADDLDIALGKHALRTGLLLERIRYRWDERRNAGGTFTFSDLDAYRAGRPTTFTRNTGDPLLTTTQTQLGLYVQDDFRAAKSLTVSGGVRQERQSTIGGAHVGPRGGAVWSPFRSGRTTVRGGGGVFFDWFEAAAYTQAIQLDGHHQQTETIVDPGYPDPLTGGHALLLPNGRVQLSADLQQPVLKEASIGVEQQLPGVRVNALWIHRRGAFALRGVNVNGPRTDGTRPDPAAGTITEIQSSGFSSFEALSVSVNFSRPERRIFIAANYMLARSLNDADTPFSLAADAPNLRPSADRR
jgi:hypothetical protein